MSGRYYSPLIKQFISALSPETALANAGTIYGLNLYLLTNSNPVNMIYNGYTIETSIPLTYDPPKLTGWQYFWRITWNNFWNSTLGKVIAVGLFTIAFLLTIGNAGLFLSLMLTTALPLAIGGAAAGSRSERNGNDFFKGFVNYINKNWAQSVAVSSALFIISVSISSFVKANKPQCFISGTKVLTSTGNKNIEDIKVGDKVWAYNKKTKKKELKEVVRLFKNGREFSLTQDNDIGEGVRDWINVRVRKENSNEELDLITCTFEHPFYVLNTTSDRLAICIEGITCNSKVGEGKWISAKDLRVGDKLLLSNGENAIISSVEIEHYDEPQITYNFEVADFHTYYVGTEGVLVHNTCPNPNGKLGGSAHQQKVADIKGALGEGNYRSEVMFKVDGMSKTRFADVVSISDGKVTAIYQVGKVGSGGLPVMRESWALADLAIATGGNIPIYFVPYNVPMPPIIFP